jgi:penicillin-binding protein 1C
VAEAATLTAMLPAPTRRAPDRSPALLLKWRNRVLDRMRAERMLTPAAHARAVAAPLGARRHGWPFLAPHHCDTVSRENRGRTVRTALNLAQQRQVERVVRAFGGAGVDGVAVVVVARASGAVQALVGSRDYRRIPLNAAGRPRAAGSTLKPFLYALAMEAGIIGPDSLLLDTRTAFRDGFTPLNFTRDFAGPIRAAEALVTSRNVPAVRLLERVGVDRFRDLLIRLGLPARGRFGLDAALGTLSVTPLGLARAYAALLRPGGEAGIDAHTRARLLEMLGRHSPAPELVPPEVLAWKTGTSSGRRDAWCAGITQDRVIVVWLGNLDGRGAPDLVGGRTAARLLAAVVAGSGMRDQG